MIELRSQKQQREQVVRSLRAEGKSWVAVAEVLRQRYRVNARVALRYAHGWSNARLPMLGTGTGLMAEDLQDFLVLGAVAE